VRIVDTRHEQTATFAAEGWAKVTRRVGVAALTAGPGVTNGISAITSAWLNGSPVFVVGGRAPVGRWGQGSLQELDHVPLVAPITKYAATAFAADDVPNEFDRAMRASRTPHRGPTFVDVPLDTLLCAGADEGAAALGLDEWPAIEIDTAHPSLQRIDGSDLLAAVVFGCGAEVVAA
jgi:acetolactate synthase-1/2/3 large subunit